jgi:hypothetical protein
MTKLTATTTFRKKIAKYIKLDERAEIDYNGELFSALERIEALASSENVEMVDCDEYLKYGIDNGRFNPEMKNVFKKHKLFNTDNLYAIFVICKECNGILKCADDCKKNVSVVACLYDTFICY